MSTPRNKKQPNWLEIQFPFPNKKGFIFANRMSQADSQEFFKWLLTTQAWIMIYECDKFSD